MMVDTLELLWQADSGIWHRPAAELVGMAAREIEAMRADKAAYTRIVRNMDSERRKQYLEIDRLREQVRIESDEAMAQKAKADHLEKELAAVKETTHDMDYWSQFVEEAADDEYLDLVQSATLTKELAEAKALASYQVVVEQKEGE